MNQQSMGFLRQTVLKDFIKLQVSQKETQVEMKNYLEAHRQ